MMLASREFAASVSPRYAELVQGLLELFADPNIVKDAFVSKKGPQPARTFFRSRFFNEGLFSDPSTICEKASRKARESGKRTPGGT